MKRFCLKLLLMSPIVLVIVMVNYKVDPANIYHEDYESKAANLLLSGQNIVGMTNYDERTLQEQIIMGSEECPNTVIIGSSRVMTLSDDVVEGMGSYQNHGVSGAGIMDYMGILGMYLERGWMPKRVIIGVDPWILNENNGDTRYQSIIQYSDKLKKVIETSETELLNKNWFDATVFGKKLQVITEIMSLSYFQSSLDYMIRNPEIIKSKTFEFYGTLEKDVEGNIRYTDGSIEYDHTFRDRSVQEADSNARMYVSGEIYQIENYKELSGESCLLLEKLIGYLQTEEIEVIFYLPPYHPFVYEYIKENKNYEMVLEAEKYFRRLAKEKGIDIYGSYNPELIDCTEENFFDGMHMRRRDMGRAWKIVDSF